MLMRPLWFVDLLKRNFRHRFRLARLSRLPVLRGIMDRMLFEGDDLVYLPKDRVVQVEINQSFDAPESIVLPSRVVHSFIDEARVHFVMDSCICRESEGCEDYPRDLGCLFMGEAASRIDPRLGRLVSREGAHLHVRRAGEAGLVHLVGRNKLDMVWLDVGPGERLLTVCNCCPCCCLWKMLPDLDPSIGGRVTKMEGVDVRVADGCVVCGTCLESCFVGAIRIVDGRAEIGDECRGCGRCVEACPNDAIAITIPDLAAVDSTISRIEDAVDVT
ncbi:MAG: 4Fe-4S binding protein [Candidatus Bathyarchaeota archaeon]|nr:4Fe-4S binding protein [Candidatus Bathyarchaeota archaeon]